MMQSSEFETGKVFTLLKSKSEEGRSVTLREIIKELGAKSNDEELKIVKELNNLERQGIVRYSPANSLMLKMVTL